MPLPPFNAAAVTEPSFTFSASSLQDYTDCPRRFQLRYLHQVVWPAAETEPIRETETRQREALVFHRLVQQHLLGLPADTLAPMANSPDLARWWHNYAACGLNFEGSQLCTESKLALHVGPHRLVAKYDLLALKGKRAVIYDWKTHARRPRNEYLASRWQTRVYRGMLVRAGSELNTGKPFEPENISMVYWFADFPTEPAEFAYDAQQFKRDWSAIESYLGEISRAQEFPLTEDRKQCRFCVYRSLCDRGERAGPLQEADDQSSDISPFDLDFEQVGEMEF